MKNSIAQTIRTTFLIQSKILLQDPNAVTASPTWGDIFESSKLKARTSLLPQLSEKRRSSFLALSFETAFENVTPSGIGCTASFL